MKTLLKHVHAAKDEIDNGIQQMKNQKEDKTRTATIKDKELEAPEDVARDGEPEHDQG